VTSSDLHDFSVSVVVTCYNYGKYLSVALESLLEQSLKNMEIIIIDDGSSDNTSEVIKPYIEDSRIRYIYQSNAGQPRAKNRGVKESSGEFIAFLDADDIWLPTKLEKQLTLFADPQVGVVYSRRKWINQDGAEISGNERTLRRGDILDHIFIDNFICFSSSVVRRSCLEDVGYFDENLPMGIDYDLWIRLAARYRFDYVDEPLVKYRTGHANLSKNTLKRYECAQKIMNKALDDPDINNKFSWHTPRLAWADTWSNMAFYLAANDHKNEAWRYFGKALLQLPVYPQLWKRMLKCLLKR
jgi:glycosyltransferase involved in cell wall biosynthesis